jgi:cytochrome c2
MNGNRWLSSVAEEGGHFVKRHSTVWTMVSATILLFAGTCLLAQQKQSPQATSAALDKMIAAKKSQKELAQYVFDNHGCNNCHTVGENGKLGFTAKGKQLTNGFEGCIRTLTAMNVIAQVPANQRSADQKTRAQRFDEFGCTLCHQIVPGKMGLTGLGAKLSHLHLGCVDVEKQVASK